MGAMINGLVQGIRYGGAAERIYFRPMVAGVDSVPDTDGLGPAQKISANVYDPAGNLLIDDDTMTIVATSSPWYYIDIDASGTTSWDYGYNYRFECVWTAGSVAYAQSMLIDVVAAPFNDPLISTAEFDTDHPSWSRARDANWTTWATAITNAHLRLMRDLRDLKDNVGTPVYPTRVLDRGQLVLVEKAYAAREAVFNGMRADETLRKEAAAESVAAFKKLSTMILDSDEDQIAEDEEEAYVGSIQFER